MEDALRGGDEVVELDFGARVLILVLMEDALRVDVPSILG